MKPRVLILYTGGTLGMERSPEGYRPMAGFGEKLGEVLNDRELPEFDVVELDHPIDSANLQPGHWSVIGRALLQRWDDYVGFVVLHGTDTMAWTASALSFMLRGIDKPVVLTGAQIPLVEVGSDAPGNLRAALLIAGHGRVREVAVCFGRHLLRGNRCSKLASTDFQAFGSPNYPSLAEFRDAIGVELAFSPANALPVTARDFVLPNFAENAVAVLTIHPGISERTVGAVLADSSVRGLILQSYGVGNVPDADPRLIAALAAAVARGVVVVNTTQCLTGSVAQGVYATGSALTRIGVVPGADMTLEAAFAKLHFLLATEADLGVIRRRIGQPLSGELSFAV